MGLRFLKCCCGIYYDVLDVRELTSGNDRGYLANAIETPDHYDNYDLAKFQIEQGQSINDILGVGDVQMVCFWSQRVGDKVWFHLRGTSPTIDWIARADIPSQEFDWITNVTAYQSGQEWNVINYDGRSGFACNATQMLVGTNYVLEDDGTITTHTGSLPSSVTIGALNNGPETVVLRVAHHEYPRAVGVRAEIINEVWDETDAGGGLSNYTYDADIKLEVLRGTMTMGNPRGISVDEVAWTTTVSLPTWSINNTTSGQPATNWLGNFYRVGEVSGAFDGWFYLGPFDERNDSYAVEFNYANPSTANANPAIPYNWGTIIRCLVNGTAHTSVGSSNDGFSVSPDGNHIVGNHRTVLKSYTDAWSYSIGGGPYNVRHGSVNNNWQAVQFGLEDPDLAPDGRDWWSDAPNFTTDIRDWFVSHDGTIWEPCRSYNVGLNQFSANYIGPYIGSDAFDIIGEGHPLARPVRDFGGNR